MPRAMGRKRFHYAGPRTFLVNSTSKIGSQGFLWSNSFSVVESFVAAFTRLAARFSFRDFPDFLDMVCRGDLSDIAAPLIMGAWLVPIA